MFLVNFVQCCCLTVNIVLCIDLVVIVVQFCTVISLQLCLVYVDDAGPFYGYTIIIEQCCVYPPDILNSSDFTLILFSVVYTLTIKVSDMFRLFFGQKCV